MQERKSQSLLQGASVLAASMIIVKLVGAVFRIPLGSILDGEGMGYYQTAYSVFVMVYSFSTAGLPAAVAKMVAEQSVRNRYQDIRKIRSLSVKLFFFMGLLGFLLMAIFSKLYVDLTKTSGNAVWSVLAISPAILFGCMMSAYRGYYEGMRNMTPTAVSQVIEVLAKLVFGLSLSGGVFLLANKQFETTGIVFGNPAATEAEMRLYASPYASAAAILGVTISTFVGTVYLVILHKRKGDGITSAELQHSPKPMRGRVLMVRLIKIAIPISIGSIVVNVGQFIDTFTIMNRLDYAFRTYPDQMTAIFGGLVPDTQIAVAGGAANFIFGSYSGYALSVFNLVPAFTGIFGKSALPNVTAAWTAHDRRSTRVNIESVIRMTCLFAMPASLGILAMAKPILTLLYPTRAAEVAIAAPVLSLQGISLIFLALATPIFAILQALGRADLPPKFMLLGAILKFVVNWVTIGIPQINVQGAAAGTVSCYATILILSLIWLRKITGFPIHFVRLSWKTLTASLLCAGTAYGMYHWVLGGFMGEGSLNTLFSIGCGAGVYVIFLLLMRGISKDDVLMLPKGEKFAKLLAKYRLLG
ncbi:MAG: putative polysaccharide biosynthesis protein [Candidatus Merdivicinus sp.]